MSIQERDLLLLCGAIFDLDFRNCFELGSNTFGFARLTVQRNEAGDLVVCRQTSFDRPTLLSVRMRILHLCKSFSPLSETFIYDYITELERQGASCGVVTRNRENEAMRPFEDVKRISSPGRWDLRRLGYRLLETVGLRERGTSYYPFLRAHLKRILRRAEVDVLHAHFGPRGSWAAPVASALHLPLVVSFHGYDAFLLPQKVRWQRQYAELFSRVQAVTVVSELMRKQLLDLGCPPDRLHLIHVGKSMDDYSFDNGGEASSPNSSVQKWVSVGRMIEKKGPLDTLQAFEKLSDDYPDISLKMVGDGALLSDARSFVEKRGLSNRVDLPGALPHEEVKRAMAQSDAFILSSKTAANGNREGVPTVLMEAQALGLPCVSTRHSGIPEVIPEENQHLLAEEGSVDGIAACMRSLMATSPEALHEIARRGRAKVEKEFNLTREVKKLRALYERVSEKPRRG